MKKLHITFLLAVLLTVSSCDTEDEYYPPHSGVKEIQCHSGYLYDYYFVTQKLVARWKFYANGFRQQVRCYW